MEVNLLPSIQWVTYMMKNARKIIRRYFVIAFLPTDKVSIAYIAVLLWLSMSPVDSSYPQSTPFNDRGRRKYFLWSSNWYKQWHSNYSPFFPTHSPRSEFLSPKMAVVCSQVPEVGEV